jgi:hypothetical protein
MRLSAKNLARTFAAFIIMAALAMPGARVVFAEETLKGTGEAKGGEAKEEEAEQAKPAPIEYPGVDPEKGGEAPLLEKAKKSKINVVTWPGFQMLPGGAGSRVFVQLCKGSQVDQITQPERMDKPPFKVAKNSLVYIFPKSVVLLRNNLNPLVSKYFNSPVLKAKMKRFKKRVYLVIELKASVLPSREQFSSYQDDLFFFFIEFEPGDYLSKPPPEEEEKETSGAGNKAGEETIQP